MNVSHCKDLNREMSAFLGEDVDIVLPYTSYNVGLRRKHDIVRQLAADLPRSMVVDTTGKRFDEYHELRLHTHHIRFCTQCALAPIVEWFHVSNIVLLECATPLHVVVGDGGSLTVCKSFKAFQHDGVPLSPPQSSCIGVRVQLDVDDTYVLISVRFSDRPCATNIRGAAGRRHPRTAGGGGRRGRRHRRCDGGGGEHDCPPTPLTPHATPFPGVERIADADHDHGKHVGIHDGDKDARVPGCVVGLVTPHAIVASSSVKGPHPIRVVPRKARSPAPLHRTVHNYHRVLLSSSTETKV